MPLDVRHKKAKTILTKQKGGFLSKGKYPFTHTLSWATGCGFGKMYCGKFCYAAHMPNWVYTKGENEDWGDSVTIKTNAAELLYTELKRMTARSRRNVRIFMSSLTDPYQPLETKYNLTRRCLEVFEEFHDLDLLVIQTRGIRAMQDFEIMSNIPYLWLSVTIETDRDDLELGPSSSDIKRRFDMVRAASDIGINTQIAVSPCLPYSPSFLQKLVNANPKRIVIDTFVAGDGGRGERTKKSPYAGLVTYNWRNDGPAESLLYELQGLHRDVSWSAGGFCGIPYRENEGMSRHFLL